MASSGARLAGKRVIVTGGASGIGRAIAEAALAEGASVGLLDRDEVRLSETAKAFGESARVAVECADIADPEAPPRSIGKLARSLGGLDGIVCAAGTTRTADCLDYALEDWLLVVGVNLTGTFLCAQAAAKLMVDAGQGGSVVTISSALAFTGQRSGVAYAASKAGVIGAVKTMALELGMKGIRCNDIAPGVVDTPLVRQTLPPDYLASWGARTPMGRIGRPEEFGPAACFLLSDESSWVTGQTLHVNGGFIMP